MSDILKWEPEQSWILRSAKVQNIERIRGDLRILADWIKTKADGTLLSGKADVAQVTRVEAAIAEGRSSLTSLRDEFSKTSQSFAKQLDFFDRWVKSGELENKVQLLCDKQTKELNHLSGKHETLLKDLSGAAELAQLGAEESLSHCRSIQQSLKTAETEVRQFIAESFKTIEDYLSKASQTAEEAKSSVELVRALRSSCDSAMADLTKRTEEASEKWEVVSEALSQISEEAELHSTNACESAKLAQKSLADCQALTKENDKLRSVLADEREKAQQQVQNLIEEASDHARVAMQNGHLASAASDMATAMKSECEELTQNCREQSGDLQNHLVATKQELAEIVASTQQHADQIAHSVQETESVLVACREQVQAIEDLRNHLHADQDAFRSRLVELDETLLEVRRQLSVSSEHLDSCQQLHSSMLEAQDQWQSLAASLQQQVSQAETARGSAENYASRMESELTRLQLNSSSFWKRLQWLFMGSPAN